MKVKNAGRWAPRGGQAWLYTALAVGVAGALRMILHPYLGPIMPGTAFLIAAALVEYFFGMTRALVAMTLGLGIADYLFVPPYEQIATLDQSDLALIISYPLITLVVIVLIERLRRAQFRAEFIASVAQSRYEMLLRLDNERALAKRAADETHRLLRHLPHYHDDIILIKAFDRSSGAAARPGAAKDVSGVAHGACFDSVHPADAVRLSSTSNPGTHRVRFSRGGVYKSIVCIAERFTTHAGDFLVFRVEGSS
jgi:K+-sensing histidine kinase KdpD